MKAVVHAGANRVEVREVAEPRLEAATDVTVKVTTSGICGSDLHMYKGRTVAKEDEIVLDPQQLS
jgi:glutathione-independent formaldehyde dehydrogenase